MPFRIFDNEKQVLSVYLIHSLPLQMSAIQVFVGSQMAVVAHLVGADTIGCEEFYSLDERFIDKPWRAMIIKDNDGDWGICMAAWVGMVPGKPGIKGTRQTRGVPGVPGKPGYFKMFFKNIRNGEIQTVILPEDGESSNYRFSLYLDQFYVNCNEGYLVIGPTLGPDIIQHVALSFVTSMLYLMVQPRLDEKIQTSSQGIKVRHPYMENNNVSFFMYCGWDICDDIPSNSYYHLHGFSGAGCISSNVDGGGGNDDGGGGVKTYLF